MNSNNRKDVLKLIDRELKAKGMGDDGFPRFILTKKGYEDTQIEVSRDPEGNEGGFLFIGETDESKVSPSRELR